MMHKFQNLKMINDPDDLSVQSMGSINQEMFSSENTEL